MALKKVNIEANGIKTFEVELKDLTLDERAEVNDAIMDENQSKNFSFWINIIRKGTELSDDEINSYSQNEIYALGSKIINDMNKKKKKK
tara:strand:+ start:5146 stop:5412 length:267 start_codon:yes stop_codon:yes gene_type:complete